MDTEFSENTLPEGGVRMDNYQNDLLMARNIAEAAAQQNGRAYFVGGFVRDGLMHRENKDIDIEVHGIAPKQLEKLLDELGQRITIGESFGIYSLKGHSLDIAMPRKEEVRGKGHRDFDVCVNPFIGTHQAALRRDFTINALMQDILTGEIIDHFGGVADLKRRCIRHVNEGSFAEDPLRVLRAAQFAARFGFTVADETVALCSRMELSHLPKERIEGELKKALLQSGTPSVFFETLRQMHKLSEWFPELEALIDIPQNPIHHPEGDVWVHTMMVLDRAAAYRDRTENPLGFMLAALTHDFGKAVCTETVNGIVHSYQHEQLGLPIAEAFLRRITGETKLVRYVLNLVEFHMHPNMLAAANSSVKATNKMFDRSEDPAALICLSAADRSINTPPHIHASYDTFLHQRLDLYRSYMAQPYVMGRDLIAAGLKPGENFADILAYAHKLRLAGVEKGPALKQVLSYADKLHRTTPANPTK